jgi:hypothetical protein
MNDNMNDKKQYLKRVVAKIYLAEFNKFLDGNEYKEQLTDELWKIITSPKESDEGILARALFEFGLTLQLELISNDYK